MAVTGITAVDPAVDTVPAVVTGASLEYALCRQTVKKTRIMIKLLLTIHYYVLFSQVNKNQSVQITLTVPVMKCPTDSRLILTV